MTPSPLELYIHIPFCIRKCQYCDFLSMPAQEPIRTRYLAALLQEIQEKSRPLQGYQVISVFLGGGTPSILPGAQTAQILETVRRSFPLAPDAEITIECNPGTLDWQKLLQYKAAGINRLSIGLQSAHNEELRLLGRIHTYEEFLVGYDLARKAGFENINIDLMSALPGQRVRDWMDTLECVIKLRPEHVSAYSLMIEEGTPFFALYGEDEQRRERGDSPRFLPDEESERKMYVMACRMLGEKGYRRYEISNYARPGRECRHNLGYWRRISYLGLGLGSASLLNGIRFSNTEILKDYLEGNYGDLGALLQGGHGGYPIRSILWLDKKQQMEEFMFLGLRMAEGISREEFRENFGIELEGIYGAAIKGLVRQGLLAQQCGRVFLTEEGISVSNYVMGQFLLGDSW